MKTIAKHTKTIRKPYKIHMKSIGGTLGFPYENYMKIIGKPQKNIGKPMKPRDAASHATQQKQKQILTPNHTPPNGKSNDALRDATP